MSFKNFDGPYIQLGPYISPRLGDIFLLHEILFKAKKDLVELFLRLLFWFFMALLQSFSALLDIIFISWYIFIDFILFRLECHYLWLVVWIFIVIKSMINSMKLVSLSFVFAWRMFQTIIFETFSIKSCKIFIAYLKLYKLRNDSGEIFQNQKLESFLLGTTIIQLVVSNKNKQFEDCRMLVFIRKLVKIQCSFWHDFTMNFSD